MASTITLRRRINSIRNTRQITKAMELVSASKMRRAQDAAKLSRDYRAAAYALLARLNMIQEVERHPLFASRPVKNKLYVVITSNSGLAGAYNSNVLKQLTHAIRADQESKVKSHVITIGNKGSQFARRLAGVELVAAYPAFGDKPTENDIRPILNTLVKMHIDGTVDEVHLLYTMFRSNISQIATDLPLLPAHLEQPDSAATASPVFNFEPDVETVIDAIATRLIEVQIWQGLLESLASEHSMRMLAMKNATDNANELIGDYTLEYNTARQAAITQELAEISGGVEALKD
ncbi:MAG TPA: ATP synthase F1 subunit gamma [Candidatus Saccharimonadales bacterium]|nr:ATP synthase F1 subunit gamma [Candidatus Saccharimonadales bacterium]